MQGLGDAILNLPEGCLFSYQIFKQLPLHSGMFKIQKVQEDINVGKY